MSLSQLKPFKTVLILQRLDLQPNIQEYNPVIKWDPSVLVYKNSDLVCILAIFKIPMFFKVVAIQICFPSHSLITVLKLYFLILEGGAQFSKLSENTVPEMKHYDQILLPHIHKWLKILGQVLSQSVTTISPSTLNWGAVQASSTGSCVLDSLRGRYQTENTAQSWFACELHAWSMCINKDLFKLSCYLRNFVRGLLPCVNI
jgi:hypothetical protein